MREHDPVLFMGKHARQEVLNLPFRCLRLICIDNCFVERFFRIKRSLYVLASGDNAS